MITIETTIPAAALADRVRHSRWLLLLAAATALAATALSVAPRAQAQEFGIQAFDGQVTAGPAPSPLPNPGDPADPANFAPAFTQAAGTPYQVSTQIRFNRFTHPTKGTNVPVEPVKTIAVDAPAGLVGSAASTERCALEDLATPDGGDCPADAIVGRLIPIAPVEITPGQNFPFVFPTNRTLYAVEPPPGVTARFGAELLGSLILIDAEVRTDGDYGISLISKNTNQAIPLIGVQVNLLGAPNGKPLLRLPTSCVGPVETTARVDSWADPGNFTEASFTSHLPGGLPDYPTFGFEPALTDPADWGPPQGVTGCDAVPFNPQVSIEPTSSEADSPTGLAVDISMPQSDDSTVLGSSDLKDTVVTLPEGFSLNPSAADGQQGCTLAQIDLDGRNTKPDCPNASKIGTVEIETPLLEDPLTGGVYLAEPNDPGSPGKENPFDTLVAYYIVAEGPGTVIKLAGKVELDPDTGQIINTFEDNPQLPFSNFHVSFFDGPHSPLATPPTCGTGEATMELTPWARPDDPVTRSVGLEVTSGPGGAPCASDPADRPFAPTMVAGTEGNAAGSFSPFILRLRREDGHQEFLSTTVTPPEGLTARLAGIPFCSEANIAAGSCGEESRIGTEVVGAGSGPMPFFVQEPNQGRVYLAGPYDPDGPGGEPQAPLSLVIHEPVIAGPFDLDDITVRAAIYVDPRTAQLRVVSDPIPRINSGIPLRIREIRIRMDRPQFTIAPTDCSEQQVLATVQGSHGGSADLANRFQVGDCAALAFAPKLRFKATEGKRATKRNFHPTLEATVSYPQSQYEGEGGVAQANIDRVVVTLPNGMFLDQDNLQTICTRAQFAANDCPEETKVGDAEAHTPLLDEPLSGPVYLIASDNQLPDLVADLNGTIEIDLYGRIDQSKRRIRNTFEVVPDAPVSHFRLTIDGGRNEGLLVNSRNTCRSKALRRVNVRVFAHNGATAHQRTQVKAPCKSAKRKLRRKARQLRRKAHRLDRRGNEAQAQQAMRRAHKVARRAKRA